MALAAAGQGSGLGAAAVAPQFEGGYVQLPTVPAAANGGPFAFAYSLEVWFSLSASTNQQRFFDLGNGGAAYNIILRDTAGISFDLIACCGDQYFNGVAGYPAIGVWYHVVFTFNATQTSPGTYTSTVVIYLNGAVAGSWTGSYASLNDAMRTSNYIGKSNANDPLYSGAMAEAVSGAWLALWRTRVCGGKPALRAALYSAP